MTAMKTIVFVASLLASANLSLAASKLLTFEAELFERICPADSAPGVSCLLSPVSLDVDCVLAAEAMPTIARAKVAEKMGILVEFSSVFAPILASHRARQEAFDVSSARGFCLSNVRTVNVVYRQAIERDYGAEILPAAPSRGPDAWFRTTMDGKAEGFSIPACSDLAAYSFYDLCHVTVRFRDPFPLTGRRRMDFCREDGSVRSYECLNDIRVADTCETDDYVLLNLPLKGRLEFFAFLPKPGVDWGRVRKALAPDRIAQTLAIGGTLAVQPGGRRGKTSIRLPKFDLTHRANVVPAFESMGFSLSTLEKLGPQLRPFEFVQQVRLVFADEEPTESPEDPASSAAPASADVRRVSLDRPFVFCVLDTETQNLLAAGVFGGRES